MITACIIGGLALVGGLRYWQNRIDDRRRSAVFIVNDGNERWLVDFTPKLVYPRLYYRYFYKIPHPTDRDMSLEYYITEGFPANSWKMRLTSESWTKTKQEALSILERPKGSFRSARRRAKKANAALGLKPTWEPVPSWLQPILVDRYKVYLKYQKHRFENEAYLNHPGRVEDLEQYLTLDGSPTCSNGSRGGSQSRMSPRRSGSASPVGRPIAPMRGCSHVRVG